MPDAVIVRMNDLLFIVFLAFVSALFAPIPFGMVWREMVHSVIPLPAVAHGYLPTAL